MHLGKLMWASAAWSLVLMCGCSPRATSDSAGQSSPAPAAHETAAAAVDTSRGAPSHAAPAKQAVAIFAGGCFWCMETQYEGAPGIHSVVSGYTGGHRANPTYHEVGRGNTGHFEAVEIRYDPARVDYEGLLDTFWRSIDPTQEDGQFCDIGGSYRAAIFASDSTQWKVAHASKQRIDASGILPGPIVTPILWAGPFYPAEEYHQDYWKKEPVDYSRYRQGCGRDRRLAQIWKGREAKPTAH